MKRCSRCGLEQPVDLFWSHPRNASRLGSRCKPCELEYSRHRYATSQRVRDLRRNNYLRSVYGLSLEDFQRMLEEQDGVCAICEQPETVMRSGMTRPLPLSVDHDHACCPGPKSCGECVRGLLCAGCNKKLHAFEGEFRTRAETYLDRYSRA